jgi:hypothetical protein
VRVPGQDLPLARLDEDSEVRNGPVELVVRRSSLVVALALAPVGRFKRGGEVMQSVNERRGVEG